MFARTARLVLRPGWPEDMPDLKRLLSQPEMLNYFVPDGDRGGFESLLVTPPHDPRMPRFLAYMRTHRAPRLVGACEIRRAPTGAPELRFCVDRTHWGIGLGTEMTSAVMHIGRASGLPPIFASHLVDNVAAGRVLRKLGFVATGRVEQQPVFMAAGDAPRSQRAAAIYVDGQTAHRLDRDLAGELYGDAGLVAA